jgi:hypothetical protein
VSDDRLPIGLIPAGYLYKKVGQPPPGFCADDHIVDICSVSGCIAEPFADYIPYWRHNVLFFFDNPAVMRELSSEIGSDLGGMSLLYFELYPEEFDEEAGQWSVIDPSTLPRGVVPPEKVERLGFDVVSYAGGMFGCSPLSCNGLHAELPVNAHCIFQDLDIACKALMSRKFEGSEPGPYRILSVLRIRD